MLDRPFPETGLQRARGEARVGIGADGRLSVLYQAGCAKAMIPRTHGTELQAVLINTAGGLTGGDRLRTQISVAPGARATAATQTAERIYRSSGGHAEIRTELTVGDGAHLDWLPQETILFEGSAMRRDLRLSLAGKASATLLETVVLGRAAMGEVLDDVRLSDQWRITRDGRLIHAEALRLSPPLSVIRDGKATLAGARAFATLVHLGPEAEGRLPGMRALPEMAGVCRASSAWNGKLVTRFIARDAQPLRMAVVAAMECMRGTPLPRVWTM